MKKLLLFLMLSGCASVPYSVSIHDPRDTMDRSRMNWFGLAEVVLTVRNYTNVPKHLLVCCSGFPVWDLELPAKSDIRGFFELENRNIHADACTVSEK